MSKLSMVLEPGTVVRLPPGTEVNDILEARAEHSRELAEVFELFGLQGINPDGLTDCQGGEEAHLGTEGIEFFEECNEFWSNDVMPPHRALSQAPEEVSNVEPANLMAVVEGTVGPSREDDKIDDLAEEVLNADEASGDLNSLLSESDRSQQHKMSAGSISIDQPADFSESRKTVRNKKRFACDVCGEKFSRTADRKTHRRIHTGEKPFTCNVCEKSFAQSAHLTVHRRIHTGEKPFSCDLCEKKFATRSSLTRHRQIHTCEGHIVYNVSYVLASF